MVKPLPRLLSGCLSLDKQHEIMAEICEVLSEAPFFTPTMPRSNKPFSVRMSNCGSLGWVSDQKSYRYQSHHPETGKLWPEIPVCLVSLWQEVAEYSQLPEACLINYYSQNAKMGLHQDKDEQNLDAPVLSISLGDSCRFRVGGPKRGDKTSSFVLKSGDVLLLEKESRLLFHGVDRIMFGSSRLLDSYMEYFPSGGRINLTMRCVN